MKYSLWFMPSGKTYNKFQAMINKLSIKYSSPNYKPHVTLIGSITDKGVLEKSVNLGEKIEGFSIHINTITYKDDYSRCIIALAEKNPEIMKAGKLARDIFKNYNKREFIPHLSLMYGDFSKKQKKEIVEKLGDIKVKFGVNSLYVVDTSGKPGDWKIIKEIGFKKI